MRRPHIQIPRQPQTIPPKLIRHHHKHIRPIRARHNAVTIQPAALTGVRGRSPRWAGRRPAKWRGGPGARPAPRKPRCSIRPMVLGAIPHFLPTEPIEIEHPLPNQPHKGKVLAAIQAHADDIPFFCGGTVAKLISEGYTAYLIQTTNDDKCGPTPSLGQTILSNEQEVETMAKALGFKATFNLGYRNHFLDGESPLELRCRLVFLLRRLKVDTILTFNPHAKDERNPDHWMTGQAAEAASWMAGMDKDYPEQLTPEIRPHTVRDLYFWVARHGQPCNRIVDVSAHVDQLVEAMSANKSQGPAGSSGTALRRRLAAQGKRLPQLEQNGADDESVDRAYIRLFLLRSFKELGQRHGLEYAEPFYYVRPGDASRINRDVDAFVAQHAVPLS